MREILFRGYNKISSKWVYGNLTHNKRGQSFICEILPETMYDVIPETLGQYTGLKDKNGDRIFEGDRLKAYLYNASEFINDVIFYNGCYHFGNFNWIEFLNKFRSIEIIGNIHDKD